MKIWWVQRTIMVSLWLFTVVIWSIEQKLFEKALSWGLIFQWWECWILGVSPAKGLALHISKLSFGSQIRTSCIIPWSSWSRMWQCRTKSPRRLLSYWVRVMTVYPLGTKIVSFHTCFRLLNWTSYWPPLEGLPETSSFFSFNIFWIWNWFTWIWKGCQARVDVNFHSSM